MLYRLTGEARYMEFCHAIIDAWEDENDPETWMNEEGCRLLTSLLEHGNVYRTAGRKAYEMLSNLVGLLELYRVDPDERYVTACTNAWHDIATKRLYVTGDSQLPRALHAGSPAPNRPGGGRRLRDGDVAAAHTPPSRTDG